MKADGDSDLDTPAPDRAGPGPDTSGGNYLRGGAGPRLDATARFGDDRQRRLGRRHVFGDDGADAMWGGRGNPRGGSDSRGAGDQDLRRLPLRRSRRDPSLNQGA